MIAEKTAKDNGAGTVSRKGTLSRLVLLGPPGAGKGTQAVWLSDAIQAVHISTGDLVREAIAADTPMGRQVKTFSDRGELVPDKLIVDLVMPYLIASEKWILDGFPRDVAQAKILEAALAEHDHHLDMVIALKIDDQLLIDRLANRRMSHATHKIYNLMFDPPPASDPGPFEQRVDDHPEEIRRRLQVYHDKTEPLLAFYSSSGLLRLIDAGGPIEVVHAKITATLAGQ